LLIYKTSIVLHPSNPPIMKNVFLLFFLFLLNGQAFSQSTAASKSVAETFAQFESVVFTKTDLPEIIGNYITLGKQQQQQGNTENATAFFERAYVLAKTYYSQTPKGRNPLESYQSILALCLQQSFADDNSGAVPVHRYLQQSNQQFAMSRDRQNTTQLSEEKVVAGFFFAATEEVPSSNAIRVETFTLRKATSLRKKATHRSTSLKRLSAGRRINVIEKTNRFWWKVEVDGVLGYAKALLME